MKKTLNALLFLAIAMLSLFVSCSKDETGIGDKRFGCKVNGQQWGPYSDDFKFNPVDVHSIITTSGKRTLLVVAYNGKNNIGRVGFFISDFQTAKDYPLTVSPNNDGFAEVNNNRYETDNSNIGVVSITSIDTVNKRVTGTFSFNAKIKTGNNTVNINNGYFDVVYKTY